MLYSEICYFNREMTALKIPNKDFHCNENHTLNILRKDVFVIIIIIDFVEFNE